MGVFRLARGGAWPLALSSWLWLAPTGVVQADALVDQASALVQSGAAREAFDLLDPQEAARAGDPAFDAAMGRAAHAAGQYSRAVLAWERVVAARPDDMEAQVALARALYAVGDQRAVLALSERARALGIPVDAALSIDQFLVSYDRAAADGGSSLKGYAELALGHDSNVNAGPASMLLPSPVPGTPAWTLAPSALARSSDFLAALVAVRGRYVMDARWSLVGAAAGTPRRNEGGAGAFDSDQFDASAGVAWRAERHELILQGQGSYYALDGTRLRSIGGVLGEWIYRIDGYRQWGSFLQSARLHYPTQPLRDVQRTVAGTSYAHVFRDGSLAYAGVHGGREEPDAAGVDYLGHRLVGLRAGGQLALARNWALFANLDWERRRYGAPDPFFAVVRRDRQVNASLGVSWIPATAWRVTPQWTGTHNDSTLPVSEYRRRIWSVTVRREF